jgi:hypothetical protein
MANGGNGSGSMDDLMAQTLKAADAALQGREQDLLKVTSEDMESFRPKLADEDKAAFDKLVGAVQASSAQNESIALFRDRVTALGGEVLDLAGKLKLL